MSVVLLFLNLTKNPQLAAIIMLGDNSACTEFLTKRSLNIIDSFTILTALVTLLYFSFGSNA